MKKHFVRLTLFLALASPAFSQSLVVDHAKICHTHSDNGKLRMFFCREGVLTFGDSEKTLSFAGKSQDNRTLGYDDVAKIVFEVTTHMRGSPLGEGALFAKKHVDEYWMYVARKGEHTEPLLLEIKKDDSEKVIDHAKTVFADRVTLPEFTEKAADIDKSKLKDPQSKYEVKFNRKEHPVPELKPDKALLVVVCPYVVGTAVGDKFRLYANDRVVAVNVLGTYSFAYLEPGKYQLVTTGENANGFEMDLEAGKDYYFLQNTFEGWKPKSRLSRNSKELVMFELDGSSYSEVRYRDSPSK